MSQLTRFRALANPEKRPTLTDINEIKHLAVFYKRMATTLRTRDLLHYLGFNINTLQTPIGDVCAHGLLTHKKYPWSICTCMRWESVVGDPVKRYKEYRSHYELTQKNTQTTEDSQSEGRDGDEGM